MLCTRTLSAAPDAMAPDGAEVRLLCQTERGSMAHFALAPGAVSRAVTHRTVDEIWHFVAGAGRMWRRMGAEESIVAVRPGVSVSIPLGAHFQFRADGDAPLEAVAVTMPPWPGEGEAVLVEGVWEAAVDPPGGRA